MSHLKNNSTNTLSRSNDSRIERTENSRSPRTANSSQIGSSNMDRTMASSTYALVQNTLNNHMPILVPDNFSNEMIAYLESIKNKPKNAYLLQNLDMFAEELEELSGYFDPISFEIINIPVRLNNRLYDLSTLEKIYQSSRKDPFTRADFKLSDIKPAEEDAENLTNCLTELNELRDNFKKNNQSLYSNKDNNTPDQSHHLSPKI